MELWQIVLLLVLVAGAVVFFLRGRSRPQLPTGDEDAKGSLPPAAPKVAGELPRPAAEASEKSGPPAVAPAKVVAKAPEKAAEKAAEKAVEAATEKAAEAPAAPEESVTAKTGAEPDEAPAVVPTAEAAAPTTSAAETAAVAVPTPVPPAMVEPREAAPARPISAAPRPQRDGAAVRRGLAQTRAGFMDRLFAVFAGKKEIDPALLDQLEETLLTGDVGAPTTRRLVDGVRDRLGRNEITDPAKVWDALRDDARSLLDLEAGTFGSRCTAAPMVILMVGVNGAGKTTTTAKLAGRSKQDGQRVLLAAADTFRAAAVQQLEMWGQRVGVPVFKGKEGAKPSAVVFEAVTKAVAEGFDVVIADTAGRLQNKAPLMDELRKTRDAASKALPGAPHEILLVLDAVTGQNALSQAKEFREALEVTGVVLTKLDGTAKGGVILAVADEFKLPVRFIGVGERADDLRDFDTAEFIDALFSREESASA